jgi:hypothetical protein
MYFIQAEVPQFSNPAEVPMYFIQAEVLYIQAQIPQVAGNKHTEPALITTLCGCGWHTPSCPVAKPALCPITKPPR